MWGHSRAAGAAGCGLRLGRRAPMAGHAPFTRAARAARGARPGQGRDEESRRSTATEPPHNKPGWQPAWRRRAARLARGRRPAAVSSASQAPAWRPRRLCARPRPPPRPSPRHCLLGGPGSKPPLATLGSCISCRCWRRQTCSEPRGRGTPSARACRRPAGRAPRRLRPARTTPIPAATSRRAPSACGCTGAWACRRPPAVGGWVGQGGQRGRAARAAAPGAGHG